jgi:uncharacterized protein DUF421
MCAVALKRSPRSRRRFALPGAKPAPYPGFIAPCDPTLRERAPEGTDWLHEIKIDGYRAQLVGLSYGMSVLTSSSKLAERLLEGTPKILVRHGRRRADEMKRQHITLAELTEALRHQGCANITQVRAAILENDGKITVIGS